MLKKDVVDFFGTQKAVADALGLTEAAISAWGEEVPRGRAFELQVLTGGRLKVEERAERRSH